MAERLGDYTARLEPALRVRALTRAMIGHGVNDGDIAVTMKGRWPDDKQALQIAERGAMIPSGAAGGGAVASLQSAAINTVVAVTTKASAIGYLLTHAVPVKLANSVAAEKVLNVATTATAKIIEPGGLIPVVQAVIDGVDVTPRKVAFIFVMTAESVAGTNGEALLSVAIKEHLILSGDTLLLDTTTGIRTGVAAIAAAELGPNSMVYDLGNLGAAVSVAAGTLSNIVYIAHPVTALRAMLAMPDLKIPILSSAALAAGEVLAVAVNALAIGGGDEIRFETSDQTVLHEEDTTPLAIGTDGSPATVAAPTRSLFQTDCKAFRLILDMGWAMRSAGGIAWLTANW